MRIKDLFALAWNGLIQNKIRFLLTALGVLIGTLGLVLILSVGEGLEQILLNQFQEGNQLKQVVVIPGFGGAPPKSEIEKLQIHGEMSDEKKQRLRRAMSFRKYRGAAQQFYTVAITPELIQEVEALPYVALIEPVCQDSYHVAFGAHQKERILGMGVSEKNPTFQERVIHGRFFEKADAKEVLVHEYLLYQWGYITEEQISSVLGQELEVTYVMSSEILMQTLNLFQGKRLLEEIPALSNLSAEQRQKIGALVQEILPTLDRDAKKTQQVLFTEKLTIVGVLQEPSRQSGAIIDHSMSLHADIFFPMKLAQDIYLRVPTNRQRGYSGLRVEAKQEDQVSQIEKFFRDKGLFAYSMETVLKRIRFAFAGITVLVSSLAGIALFVASLGIANTMVMSVLERTKEIGIMKAIGAQDWHIRGIFFIESAYIGIVGGFLGVSIAVLSSYPLESFGKEYIRKKAHETLDLNLFYFPLWLILGGFFFAVILSILAAWFPSRRATRIDPIETLRHE